MTHRSRARTGVRGSNLCCCQYVRTRATSNREQSPCTHSRITARNPPGRTVQTRRTERRYARLPGTGRKSHTPPSPDCVKPGGWSGSICQDKSHCTNERKAKRNIYPECRHRCGCPWLSMTSIKSFHRRPTIQFVLQIDNNNRT